MKFAGGGLAQVGRRPVRGAEGKAIHRKATAKVVNPNGLSKTLLSSPSISAAKLQPRSAAYLRSNSKDSQE